MRNLDFAEVILTGAKGEMQTELEYRTLIDLFNGSLAKIKSLDKECLEIIRQLFAGQ